MQGCCKEYDAVVFIDAFRLVKLLHITNYRVEPQTVEPDGNEEKKEMEVFKFNGAGGVALSMYNTDEVQTQLFFPLFSPSPRGGGGLNNLLEVFNIYCFYIFKWNTVYPCFR